MELMSCDSGNCGTPLEGVASRVELRGIALLWDVAAGAVPALLTKSFERFASLFVAVAAVLSKEREHDVVSFHVC
jgi:hypothetical protein